MAKNPYDILGIDKKADEKAIKSAYRKLAKKYHPDLNPGDKEAAQKFSDATTAYDLLSDKEKRAAYDRGEIDMEGHPQYQQQYYKDFAEGPEGNRYYHFSTGDGRFDPEDIEDIFGSFFSGGMAGRKAGFKRQAADAYYAIEIDFIEAVRGGKKRVTMPDGRTLDIAIPAGIEDGQKLRLKGQGGQGSVHTPAGDAYVEIHIRPHRLFIRKGKDIHIEIPIAIHESAMGGKIKVPTIHGPVETSVPKGASTGTTLRLKGKGIKGGDQYIKLRLVMPETVDKELEETLRKWADKHAYNPRKHMEGSL